MLRADSAPPCSQATSFSPALLGLIDKDTKLQFFGEIILIVMKT